MSDGPKVQSILSSRKISHKEAQRLLTKFLAEQKKYNEDSATDLDPSNGASGEDFFDMEDDENSGTFEEIQARLEGILRSLSGVKKPVITSIPETLQNEAVDDAGVEEEENTSSSDQNSGEEPVGPIISTPIKQDSDEAAAEEKSSEISKSDKKAKKRAEKEERKSAKKAEKEAAKEAKRAKKEAEKEQKKAKKKAAKEAKKAAKKEKRKRSADDNGSRSSAKKVKKE